MYQGASKVQLNSIAFWREGQWGLWKLGYVTSFVNCIHIRSVFGGRTSTYILGWGEGDDDDLMNMYSLRERFVP